MKRAPTAAPADSSAPTRGRLLFVAFGDNPNAQRWIADVAKAGYDVHVEREARVTAFQWANENRPVLVVIDVSNKPQDIERLADTLRVTRTTATIPVVVTMAAREPEGGGGGGDGGEGTIASPITTLGELLKVIGRA